MTEFNEIREKLTDFIKQYNLDKNAVQRYIDLACSLTQYSSIKFQEIANIKLRLFKDEESEWLQLTIYIDNIVIDEVVDMTFKLARACADLELPIEVMRHFLISYQIWPGGQSNDN